MNQQISVNGKRKINDFAMVPRIRGSPQARQGQIGFTHSQP